MLSKPFIHRKLFLNILKHACSITSMKLSKPWHEKHWLRTQPFPDAPTEVCKVRVSEEHCTCARLLRSATLHHSPACSEIKLMKTTTIFGRSFCRSCPSPLAPSSCGLAPVLLPRMPPAAGQRTGRVQPIPSQERRVALSEL